jgi:hypothetical protein
MRCVKSKTRWFPVILACVITAVAGSEPVGASDSLATPITGRQVQELWPLEVEVEIVRGADSDVAHGSPASALTPRTVVVPDGHPLRFSTVIRTPRGKRRFDLAVVPRHHPESIELEWDLEVSEATFRLGDWQSYLLHRLHLGPQPGLDDERLKIARSDIVQVRDGSFRHTVDMGDEAYEIRIIARSLRG